MSTESARRSSPYRTIILSLGTVGALLLSLVLFAGPAAAAGRDGVCDSGEFCYYFNSNEAGSVSDFTGSILDYGATQPSCYEFKGPGLGQGVCVKNNAASARNLSGSTVRVYVNSGYGGHFQDFAPGAAGNLDATLKNNEASHQFFSGSAAPGRTNSKDKPVYLVHGIDFFGFVLRNPQSDCAANWGAAISKFRALGWTGPIQTVGFYAADTNCTVKIANGDANTAVEEFGRLLAWDVYNRYSHFGKSVDLVGHSMGGVIIRAAVTGVAKHLAGWPPYIYVEDGVTLSSPHNGTGLARGCGFGQCVQMRPGSDFLNVWLTANVQSTIGTDWTYLGAADDDIVPVASATRESRAGHYVWFTAGQPLEHTQINSNVNGPTKFYFWNWQNGIAAPTLDAPATWPYYTNQGQSAIELAENACYYWSDR